MQVAWDSSGIHTTRIGACGGLPESWRAVGCRTLTAAGSVKRSRARTARRSQGWCAVATNADSRPMLGS